MGKGLASMHPVRKRGRSPERALHIPRAGRAWHTGKHRNALLEMPSGLRQQPEPCGLPGADTRISHAEIPGLAGGTPCIQEIRLSARFVSGLDVSRMGGLTSIARLTRDNWYMLVTAPWMDAGITKRCAPSTGAGLKEERK